MKFFAFVTLVACLSIGCQQKKKEKKDTSKYFPVLSYLQSQVKHLDTSLFRFSKIETGLDTVIINRSEIRKYAKDFLEVPDITKSEYGSDYRETNMYDSSLGMVVMSYLADDEDLDYPRQEVQVIPSFGGNDQVKTIYIEKVEEEGKTTIEKKMIWEVNQYFQVRTITHKPNEPEKIHDLKIIWQDFESN